MFLAMSHHYKVDKKTPLKMKNRQTNKKRTDESSKTDNEPQDRFNAKVGSKTKILIRLDFSTILHLSLQDLHIGAVNLQRKYAADQEGNFFEWNCTIQRIYQVEQGNP